MQQDHCQLAVPSLHVTGKQSSRVEEKTDTFRECGSWGAASAPVACHSGLFPGYSSQLHVNQWPEEAVHAEEAHRYIHARSGLPPSGPSSVPPKHAPQLEDTNLQLSHGMASTNAMGHHATVVDHYNQHASIYIGELTPVLKSLGAQSISAGGHSKQQSQPGRHQSTRLQTNMKCFFYPPLSYQILDTPKNKESLLGLGQRWIEQGLQT